MKSIIITGGNSGLGYKTALNLAKQGADWNAEFRGYRGRACLRLDLQRRRAGRSAYGETSGKLVGLI